MFDSDYKTNPAVCAELHKLAEYLDYLGAFVYIVTLPLAITGHEGKVGLDDFLVKEQGAKCQIHAAIKKQLNHWDSHARYLNSAINMRILMPQEL